MKNNLKVIFSILLAALLLLLPSCNSADGNKGETTPAGDVSSLTDESGAQTTEPVTMKASVGLEFELSENGKYYTLVGLGDCMDVDIVVPGTYESLPVKAIAKEAFKSKNVLSIYIPDTVEDLQMGMLIGCDSLKTLTMPSTELSKVRAEMRHPDGNYVVSPSKSLESLETVHMTKGEKVDYYTFYNVADNLETLTLPDTLVKIGSNTFTHTPKLKEIVIPASVEEIDENAFRGCSNLRSVRFEKGSRLSSLGKSVFVESAKLVSVEFDEACPLTELSNTIFSGCKALKTVNIPTAVKKIGEGVFVNCNHLTSVTLPDTLEEIGAWAFRNTRIEEINIPASVKLIGKQAFYECEYIQKLTVEEGNGVYYSSGNCLIQKEGDILLHGAGEVVIPESVKEIAAYAFSYNTTAKSVTIPKGISVIREFAFEGCSALVSVKFEDGSLCKTIERFVFRDCKALSDVELPTAIEDLGACAFENCQALTKFTVPASIKNFGEGIFQGCIELSDVTILAQLTTIPKQTFYQCKNLEKLTLPESVTEIGSRAFSYGLTEINIPKACKRFEGQAFYGCINLRTINYGGTLAQWKAIDKGYYYDHRDAWNKDFASVKIVCTNGTV